ncbi:MAG: asparagine synthase (glutamine-hydrolyzing), partial [Longimicrobiales bacterium]
MCGIAGIVDPRGVTAREVESMATAQAHRGPDDATTYVEPGMGFGFRRLSIIDLSGGRQPIQNETGSLQVILNGEIYNYRSLRRELEGSGHCFATDTDTEVLVHLYEEEGPGLVHRLRGMFAFALWDAPKRTLFMARDHLGQKPLYWAQIGTRFLFASEIKSILAAAPELRRLNPIALHEYLSIRVVAEPRSMFEGVHKLPPAHTLELDAQGKVEIQRYWRLRYEPKRALHEVEALEELDRRVREAVELHLISDVEVGAFLSGGYDSGIIAGVTRDLYGHPFKTFSGSTPYGEFDEASAARAVAARYGTEHFETRVSGESLALLPTLVHHLDEPSDPLSACIYLLAELASRHVKVVLGGDGGDELFAGYDRYYGTRYAGYYALLPEFVRKSVVRRLADHLPEGFWYKSLSHRLRWLDDLASLPRDRRYPRALSYFYFTPEHRQALYSAEFAQLSDAFDAEAAIATWLNDDGAREALDRLLLADSMVRLPNHPVMILDRMTMAHGLEARSPFLDHTLAEFAATLPTDLKLRGRTRRYLEGKLAARYLPPAVHARPKQG